VGGGQQLQQGGSGGRGCGPPCLPARVQGSRGREAVCSARAAAWACAEGGGRGARVLVDQPLWRARCGQQQQQQQQRLVLVEHLSCCPSSMMLCGKAQRERIQQVQVLASLVRMPMCVLMQAHGKVCAHQGREEGHLGKYQQRLVWCCALFGGALVLPRRTLKGCEGNAVP